MTTSPHPLFFRCPDRCLDSVFSVVGNGGFHIGEAFCFEVEGVGVLFARSVIYGQKPIFFAVLFGEEFVGFAVFLFFDFIFVCRVAVSGVLPRFCIFSPCILPAV